MYILIVGGGKVGESLARTLSSHGHDIALIEKDEKMAARIAEDLEKVLVIGGDGCDPNRLEDAGAKRAQVVAAVTGDDEDNLIICQISKETFGVPRTIARVNNPRNLYTFQKLGIDAISATTIIAKLIEEESTVGDIINLLALKRGKLSLVEVRLSEPSAAVDTAIKDLKLPADVVIAAIFRGNNIIFPKGDTILKIEDSVLALTTTEKEKELTESLLGKE